MPLPLRRRVGQVLIGSLPGTAMAVELTALAREFDLGGVTLFGRNVEGPEQVADLSIAVETLGREQPAWVAVDQEGGRVARLRAPFTVWPPMAALGRADVPMLAERFAHAMARELRAVGVTLDFAPVLDLSTNPANTVIGDRALSADAARVADLGATLIRAFQTEGIAACGKHFPGHGDTIADSHVDLPLVEHSLDRLRAVEFVPFRAAVAADVACLMTAHVVVPCLDESRPATLSSRVVGLIREDLAFSGLIATDDLEMQAIARQWPPAEAAVEALSAGCDAVLVCSGNIELQAAVLEGLVRAIESGRLAAARVESAIAAGQRQKARFARVRSHLGEGRREWRQVVGCDAHQRVAAEMAAFA